ncbi:SRPBCC family protein [Mesorhizobium amorphae]|uniref:SRPBCC family protein n=1 Tax=Mesorhizobium amorphae TaxID=71433 RepID=UPI0011832501|nr:SRPBCC family protein [Mesorhizobium amorphae]
MMRRNFRQEIHVTLPVDEAFLLFTPKGEEAWVPGWSPDYILPATGETGKDMIFRTGSGEEATIWTCLDWQPERHHVRYLRTTPALRVAFVQVDCCGADDNGTRVAVSYDYVPLTAKGQDMVARMTQETFSADINGWSVLIADYLQGAVGPDHPDQNILS